MSKFETVGVNLQYDSQTKEIALKRFSRSCDCCVCKGLHIECSRCAIATVHELVMATFEDNKKGGTTLCQSGKKKLKN